MKKLAIVLLALTLSASVFAIPGPRTDRLDTYSPFVTGFLLALAAIR